MAFAPMLILIATLICLGQATSHIYMNHTGSTNATTITSTSSLVSISPSQSQPQSSRSSTETSSVAIGDLVASGLGLTGSNTTSSAPTTTMMTASSVALDTAGFPLAFHSNATVTAATNTSNATMPSGMPTCLAALSSWGDANNAWLARAGHTIVVNASSLTVYQSVYGSNTAATPYTTLCDGWPRAYGSYYLSIPSTSTLWTTSTSIASPYPTPPPSCELNNAQCNSWWSAHDSCSLTNGNAFSSTLNVSGCGYYTVPPPCSQPANFSFPARSSFCGGQCTLYAEEMQLFYWPVTTVNDNVCNKTGTTITDTVPKTATIAGTAVASPNVAFSIPSLYAYDECGHLGTDLSDVVVTMPASDVYVGSRGGMHVVLGSATLDYADLAPNPVPSSAWFNQPFCGSYVIWSSSLISATGAAWTSSFGELYPQCGTIWQDDYQPVLVNPTQVNDLQAAWAGCTAVFGLYDPPKALTEVASEAAPTVPGQTTAQSATPAQTATAQPVQTTTSASPAKATAEPDSKPTSASTAGSDDGTPKANSDPTQAASQPSSTADPAPSVAQQPSANDPASTPGVQSSADDPAACQGGATQESTANAGGAIASVLGAATTATAQNGPASDPTGQGTASPGSSSEESSSDSSQDTSESDPSTQGAVDSDSAAASVNPVAVILLGSSVLTAQAPTTQSGNVVLGSATLAVGDSAVINNTPVAVVSNGLVVGSSDSDDPKAQTVVFSTPTADPNNEQARAGAKTTISVGGSSMAVSSVGNAIVLGSNTLTVGGAAQTINGQVVNAASDGLAIGTSTLAVPTSPSNGALSVDNGGPQLAASSSGNALVIGSNTVSIGGPAQTINGQVVSAAANDLVLGSTTVQIADGLTTETRQAVITGSNGESFTIMQQGSSAILVDGSSTTTVPLGAQVTFDGNTISLPNDGGSAVVDGSVIALSTGAADSAVTDAVVTGADDQLVTILRQGSSVVLVEGSSTSTIPLGAQVTFDGDVISLASGGGSAVVDGKTVALSTDAADAAVTEAVLTGTDGQLVTILRQGSTLLIEDAGTALRLPAGAQVTLDGETISVPTTSASEYVVIDGSTVPLSTSVPSSTRAISQGTVPPPSSRTKSAAASKLCTAGSMWILAAGALIILLAL